MEDAVNCDISYGDVRVDLSRGLPFKDNSADIVATFHFIEHLHRWEVLPFIKECYRVIKNQGFFVVEMPDFDKICRMIQLNADPAYVLLGLYGEIEGENEYMTHKWCWNFPEFSLLLREAGFALIRSFPPRTHRPERDFRIEAKKCIS